MLPRGDLTMSELRDKADPSPVPPAGQVSASSSPQTTALLRCAESWAPLKHGDAETPQLRLNIDLC